MTHKWLFTYKAVKYVSIFCNFLRVGQTAGLDYTTVSSSYDLSTLDAHARYTMQCLVQSQSLCVMTAP